MPSTPRSAAEKPVSRALLLRRRIGRLGFAHVGGQLAFMLFQRMQQQAAKRRIADIVAAAGLEALAKLHEIGGEPHAAALERLKRELGDGIESIDLLFSL